MSAVPLIAVFMLACSEKQAPRDLLDELAGKQARGHLTIGWIYDTEVNAIAFGATPEMRKYAVSIEAAKRITSASEEQKPRHISSGSDAVTSPDGRWMTYRTHANEFVLVDVDGKATPRLLGGRRIVTPIYWSPDSDFLMYVEKGGTWDRDGLRCLDDTFAVMVYRVRDGVRGSVVTFCQGYPYWALRWLRMPVGVGS